MATASTDLKGELCTPKISLLLLPEIVRLDDECHADLSWEKLLQRLEQRLDEFPLRAAHVDDDGEAAFTHVLTGGVNTVKMEHNMQSAVAVFHTNTHILIFLSLWGLIATL